MSDDLLLSTSHYNKEILILNNFPKSHLARGRCVRFWYTDAVYLNLPTPL